MSKILSKIGKKKRIAGKKNRWKKSKIGSALAVLAYNNVFKHSTQMHLTSDEIL